MRILLNLFLSTLAVLICAYIIQGTQLDGFFNALVVAVVLGIINAFIKPVIKILTLPINIVTLGLFSLVINALMIMLASAIVPGFEVAGFWSALLFSILLSLVNWVLFTVLPDKK